MTEAPTHEPTTDRGRATKQALLEAAEQVFLEESYDRASVAEITRRAGVAQGTFYLYFPDKKAAFGDLVRKLNREMRRHIAEAVTGITDRIEMERVGFRAFFDYITEHNSVYRVVREAEFVDIDVYNWHYRTLVDGYRRGLAAAAEQGQICRDIDPETLAWILMGIAEFQGGHWIIGRGAPPPEEVLDQIMLFIERGVGRPGQAAGAA